MAGARHDEGLEAQLPSETFARIHRSTIINLDRVVELLPCTHREMIVVLHDGTRLQLSRSYRDQAEAFFGSVF